MSDSARNPSSSRLLAYCQLFRLPNVFTAIADVSAGYLLVHVSLAPAPAFLLLVLASAFLYTAGMVLNDVYDLEIDRVERPQRPLPSGRIDIRWARIMGYGMLLSGVAAAAVAGLPFVGNAHYPWRPLVVAASLAACVVLYDAALKKTLAGPALMGACRFFNVLLGASTAVAASADLSRLGYGNAELTVAGGIGIYILGVTLFARSEAGQSSRSSLSTALAIIILGMAALTTFPNRLDYHLLRQLGKVAPLTLDVGSHWLLLMGLLAVTVVRRCLIAIADPSPVNVQLAVKHSILSLISLNAAVALQIGGVAYGLGVFALVIPAMLLGRWVYST